MEVRTAYGRYTGWNDLHEPHGNRDGSTLHQRAVGEGIGRTVRSVDGARLEEIGVKSARCGAISRNGFPSF